MAFSRNLLVYYFHLLISQMRGVPVFALCLFAVGGSVLVFIASAIYSRVRRVSVPFSTRLLLSIMLFYACFMLMITLFNREPDSRKGVFMDILSFLQTGKVINYRKLGYALLNVILFVPWGMLLGFLWERETIFKRSVMVAICCFVSSFAIEVVQLITSRGYFEVEDIVMNTLGGLAGVLLLGIPLHFVNRHDSSP